MSVCFSCRADNGEEFLPNRFVKSCSWAGSYKSLAHYCTRGWCRLEMLLGQTEPLPQDGFMFNFLVPKKKKVGMLFSVCYDIIVMVSDTAVQWVVVVVVVVLGCGCCVSKAEVVLVLVLVLVVVLCFVCDCLGGVLYCINSGWCRCDSGGVCFVCFCVWC